MNELHDTLEAPDTVPEPGFYYHYKHDRDGAFNGYAYEVMGIGHHTEDDCRPEDQFMVVYRPLYDWAKVYQLGKMFDLRPLAMFMEEVKKPEYTGPRFTKIDDSDLIEKMRSIREEMYPQG